MVTGHCIPAPMLLPKPRYNLEIKFPERLPGFEILLDSIKMIKHQEKKTSLPELDEKDQPIFQGGAGMFRNTSDYRR